jgi:hypothetical protein
MFLSYNNGNIMGYNGKYMEILVNGSKTNS